MVSCETIAVLLSGLVGTLLAVAVDAAGGFDDWTGLFAFLYLGLFWYVIPQLYLGLAGDDLSGLRLRLIPVILCLLAVAVSLRVDQRARATHRLGNRRRRGRDTLCHRLLARLPRSSHRTGVRIE